MFGYRYAIAPLLAMAIAIGGLGAAVIIGGPENHAERLQMMQRYEVERSGAENEAAALGSLSGNRTGLIRESGVPVRGQNG